MSIPRRVAALRHDAVAVEFLHLDDLHLGGAEGDEVFASKARYDFLLVLVELMSGFIWWEPAPPLLSNRVLIR